MAVPFVWLNRCRRHCHVSGCVMTGHPHGGSEGVLPRVIKESTCARADYATLRATAMEVQVYRKISVSSKK